MRNFMLKYRSSFYCQICDYQNHHFFNLKHQKISLNKSSCFGIAEHTINFIYQLNMKIARPLWFLSKVIGPFLTHPVYELKVRHQRRVFAAVMKCAKAFSSNSSNQAACKNLCGFFNFNANSPVIEGYRVWFNDYYNFLKSFYKEIGHDYEKHLAEKRKLSFVFSQKFL